MRVTNFLLLSAVALVAFASAVPFVVADSPNTCTSNAQAPGGIHVHLVCQEPDPNPCLAKVQAPGVHVKCRPHSPVPTP